MNRKYCCEDLGAKAHHVALVCTSD